MNTANARLLAALALSLAAVFIWSLIRPNDWFTWFLEALPVMIGVPVLVATYRRFPFTSLVYLLICAHAVILLVGAHYTYAHEPLFGWLRDTFHLARNDYDRLGHFAQGFVPAMIAREIIVRKSPLKSGGWLFTFVTCFCLAFSALFELWEWQIAVASGSTADDYLATQGDPWDTQKDMAMALIGAVVAQLTLSRFHDRLLRR